MDLVNVHCQILLVNINIRLFHKYSYLQIDMIFPIFQNPLLGNDIYGL